MKESSFASPGGFYGFPYPLDRSRSVCKCPVFLCKTCGRQYNIGKLSRFGHKDILNDQEIQIFLTPLSCGSYRVAQDRIFSHNIQCLKTSVECGPGHLRSGKAFFVRQFNAPGLLKFLL